MSRVQDIKRKLLGKYKVRKAPRPHRRASKGAPLLPLTKECLLGDLRATDPDGSDASPQLLFQMGAGAFEVCVKRDDSQQVLAQQDKLRLQAAALLVKSYESNNYREKALEVLRSAVHALPRKYCQAVMDSYGAPVLASRLRIAEPFTNEALEEFAVDSVKLVMLGPIAEDRILGKHPRTVISSIYLAGKLMEDHQDMARTLSQHAYQIGRAVVSEEALLSLHCMMDRMLKLDDRLDFQCFLPLLKLAAFWATSPGMEKGAHPKERREVRPFNDALKVFAQHRERNPQCKGRDEADTVVLWFLQNEPRHDDYSTYHFTDGTGNFRPDWYSPQVAKLLASMSTHLAYGYTGCSKAPRLWRRDAMGRTPIYVLVGNVPWQHLKSTGVFDHWVQNGACLCTPDYCHKFRACHILRLKCGHEGPAPSLQCLAARTFRKHYPRKNLTGILPSWLVNFIQLH